jgi:general secretion pathway protein L
MQLVALWKRWVGTLTLLFVAWRERRREQHALTLALENQHVVVRNSQGDGSITRPHFQPGQVASTEFLEAARNRFVVLEFPGDKVVRREITVPVQARKFLSGVIRNQIERLSPWPSNNVVYGFNSEASRKDASVVDVRILMASRTDIDASRNQLAGLGVEVDRIVANNSNDETAGSVILWSRSMDASQDRLEKASRVLGAGIGSIVAVCICVSLWASVSTGLVRDESESIAASTKGLQRQVQGGRTLSSAASMPPAERLWFLKEASVSSVILLEALSRALPDSAYLTEFRLENATLRMTGLADDAPRLLAPLEQSGHLTGVRFFAPTTRTPEGKSSRFSIEGHVEPRSKLVEE